MCINGRASWQAMMARDASNRIETQGGEIAEWWSCVSYKLRMLQWISIAISLYTPLLECLRTSPLRTMECLKRMFMREAYGQGREIARQRSIAAYEFRMLQFKSISLVHARLNASGGPWINVKGAYVRTESLKRGIALHMNSECCNEYK